MDFADKKKMTEYRRGDIAYYAIAAAIVILGTALRFIYLTQRPLHHDEGVNGWFLANLFREGIYKYDPANYHGPTLYYIALLFVEVFGLNTTAIRASVAIWGVFIVIASFWLRPYLGTTGTLLSAFFLAVSPGLLFISRYFIHETFFVFLSFAVLICILQYNRRQAAGAIATISLAGMLFILLLVPLSRFAASISEDDIAGTVLQIAASLGSAGITYFIIRYALSVDSGRPIYIALSAALIALMFATKETAPITIAVMILAAACIALREAIASAARQKQSPAALSVLAAAAGSILALGIRYKIPETATDFAKRTAELTGFQEKAIFEIIFYLFLIFFPPLSVIALYRYDLGRIGTADARNFLREIRTLLPGGRKAFFIAAASLALAVYIIVFFFSSLFTYPKGISGFFEAYKIWAQTGSKDHTQNGFWAYAVWGIQSDGPIMIASLLGAVIAILKGTNRLALFVAFWSLGLFAAYTLIPYKTPWLALSFLLPMCLSAGYGLGQMLESKSRAIRIPGALFSAIAIVVTLVQTRDLNFVRYDDEDAPMVYAHTQREFDEMVARIEKFARASGKGNDAKIEIISPDYWPLVWYLRDYPNAVFYGRMNDATDAEIIVAKKDDQDDAVIRRFSANYRFFGPYKLRAGVKLIVLVRKDIPGNDGRELYELHTIGPDSPR